MMSTLEKLTIMYEEEYQKYIKRVQNRVGNVWNAEDVVQESFTRALKYLDSYDGSVPLDNWFSTILNNAARDCKKQEMLDGMSYGDEDEEGTDTLDNSSFKTEMVEKIAGEIHQLHGPIRAALAGTVIHGWKPSEVAEISTLSANHIRVLLCRFKDEMREKYGADMCS